MERTVQASTETDPLPFPQALFIHSYTVVLNDKSDRLGK